MATACRAASSRWWRSGADGAPAEAAHAGRTGREGLAPLIVEDLAREIARVRRTENLAPGDGTERGFRLRLHRSPLSDRLGSDRGSATGRRSMPIPGSNGNISQCDMSRSAYERRYQRLAHSNRRCRTRNRRALEEWRNRTIAEDARPRRKEPRQHCAACETTASPSAKPSSVPSGSRHISGGSPSSRRLHRLQLPNWLETVPINLAACILGLVVNPIVPIYRRAPRSPTGGTAARRRSVPERFQVFRRR